MAHMLAPPKVITTAVTAAVVIEQDLKLEDVDEDHEDNALTDKKDGKEMNANKIGSNAPKLETRRLTTRQSLTVPVSPTDRANSPSKNLLIARRLGESASHVQPHSFMQRHGLPQIVQQNSTQSSQNSKEHLPHSARPPSRLERRAPLCWQTGGNHLALALKPKTIVSDSSNKPASRPSLLINVAKS